MAVGWSHPSRLGPTGAAIRVVAMVLLVAWGTTHYPVASVAIVAVGAMAGAAVGVAVGALAGRIAPRVAAAATAEANPEADPGAAGAGAGAGPVQLGVVLASGLLTVLVFLTVPDTEGAVLLVGVAAVEIAGWWLRRWTIPFPSLGLLAGAALTATGCVAWVGSASRWSLGGWWVLKTAMVIAFVAWAGVTTARARRPQ